MVACADVHLGRARQFAEPFDGRCQVYQDYRKILDRKDVAAVTIGTPDHWHVKIAIDAMEAGKDVYCEKPLTLTIEEGKTLCRAVCRLGRVFQVGTQQRSEYNRSFLEAVAIARSGWLGQKLKAIVHIGPGVHDGPFENEKPPDELNWDFWLGQAPKVPYCDKRFGSPFRWWFDYSGGHVTDWGAHHTDIALWALGGENTGVASVEGRGDFPIGRELMRDYLLGKKLVRDLPNSFNVVRTFDYTLTLPNGNTIRVNSEPAESIYIEGEKGHLAANRGGIHGKFVDELKKDPAGRERLDAAVAKLYRNRPIISHMADFFSCMKDRARRSPTYSPTATR